MNNYARISVPQDNQDNSYIHAMKNKKEGVLKTSRKRVRINMVIEGEPAKWLEDWKRRGLVTSYTDAVLQSIRVFNEKITEQDLKITRLKNMRNIEEEY